MTAVTREVAIKAFEIQEETIERLRGRIESQADQIQALLRDYGDLSQAYQRYSGHMESYVADLDEALRDSRQESEAIWRLVPAWVQKQEIIKRMEWETRPGPVEDSVTIQASVDFRGCLSVVTMSSKLSGDRLQWHRQLRKTIHGLQAGLVSDQFKIHRITENDVHRNGRGES